MALTLSSLEDLIDRGRLDARQQRQLMKHGKACESILLDIQKVLKEYESLSTKSRRIHDILGWDYEGARDLRSRLTATVSMLSSFYHTLTTTSIFRLEDALNRMMQEIQKGRKSADSVSILTTATSESLDTPQAWRQVIRDLEDLGIDATVVEKNRKFIVNWFSKALESSEETVSDKSSDSTEVADPVRKDPLSVFFAITAIAWTAYQFFL